MENPFNYSWLAHEATSWKERLKRRGDLSGLLLSVSTTFSCHLPDLFSAPVAISGSPPPPEWIPEGQTCGRPSDMVGLTWRWSVQRMLTGQILVLFSQLLERIVGLRDGEFKARLPTKTNMKVAPLQSTAEVPLSKATNAQGACLGQPTYSATSLSIHVHACSFVCSKLCLVLSLKNLLLPLSLPSRHSCRWSYSCISLLFHILQINSQTHLQRVNLCGANVQCRGCFKASPLPCW